MMVRRVSSSPDWLRDDIQTRARLASKVCLLHTVVYGVLANLLAMIEIVALLSHCNATLPLIVTFAAVLERCVHDRPVDV
jgi:hypothetical protein